MKCRLVPIASSFISTLVGDGLRSGLGGAGASTKALELGCGAWLGAGTFAGPALSAAALLERAASQPHRQANAASSERGRWLIVPNA
jgi:hypothetical protein